MRKNTATPGQHRRRQILPAKPTGPARASGTTATMTGRITGNDRSTAMITAQLAEHGAGWCLAGTQVG